MHCRHENSWRPGQARPWLPRCQCHCVSCWWLQQNCSPSKPRPGPECSNKDQGVKRNQGWHCHLKEFNMFKLQPPVKNTWQRHGMACKGLQRHDTPWKQLEPGTGQALAPSVPMSLRFMLMTSTELFTFKASARAWMQQQRSKCQKKSRLALPSKRIQHVQAATSRQKHLTKAWHGMQRIAKAWHAMKAIGTRDRPGLGFFSANATKFQVEVPHWSICFQDFSESLNILQHQHYQYLQDGENQSNLNKVTPALPSHQWNRPSSQCPPINYLSLRRLQEPELRNATSRLASARFHREEWSNRKCGGRTDFGLLWHFKSCAHIDVQSRMRPNQHWTNQTTHSPLNGLVLQKVLRLKSVGRPFCPSTSEQSSRSIRNSGNKKRETKQNNSLHS